MCGISGILGICNPETASSMASCMAHRGPDGFGIFSEDIGKGTQIALGHSRLSIIDIRGSSQPIVDDSASALVHNGEIYNYGGIRQTLSGFQWATSGDSETILALHKSSVSRPSVAPEFARGKPVCGIRTAPSVFQGGNPAEKHVDWVSKLDGIWGFALWDSSRRELILCRDPMGVKPLLRTILPNGALLFASEVKAFHGHPEFIPMPDIESLAVRLAFEYPLDHTTLFQGVTQVGQGTIETWGIDSRGRAVLTGIARYSSDKIEPNSSLEIDQYATTLLDSLDSSVKDRMMSETPIGIVLSGGLDSSLIANLAKDASDGLSLESPECWTVAGSEDNPDLISSVNVAESLDMKHNIDILEDDIFWKKLPRFCWDGEDLDVTVLFWQPLFQSMSNKVKVGLCGQGADELHGGYSRYGELYRHSRIVENRLNLAKGVDISSLPSGPGQPWVDASFSTDSVFSSIQSTLQFEMDRGQLSNFQLRLADRHSMATGLEVRVPFLGQKHREASNTMPIEWRVSKPLEKIALRKSARLTRLPEDIVSRPKLPAGTATAPNMVTDLISELEPHALEWSADYGQLAPMLIDQPDMAIGIRIFHATHLTEGGIARSSKDIMSVINDVGDWPR
ncbi:MAG: asparagine synthase (glutamine-hydrolyzing) [Candidatus Thermoplasmatota archaeon]|nr:asparagine synthase (glutamine-hydrolyzing) [Candidatus Thermoplasmatota archaeon]